MSVPSWGPRWPSLDSWGELAAGHQRVVAFWTISSGLKVSSVHPTRVQSPAGLFISPGRELSFHAAFTPCPHRGASRPSCTLGATCFPSPTAIKDASVSISE
ncbi:hypothetical protein H8959_022206 [Pygathrix nigripes]